jgi:hypothetical protein
LRKKKDGPYRIERTVLAKVSTKKSGTAITLPVVYKEDDTTQGLIGDERDVASLSSTTSLLIPYFLDNKILSF